MPIQLTQYAPSFRDLLKGFLARTGESFIRAMEMQARVDQIEALQGKSDSELERLGLTREQIPYFVFRDKAWM